MIEEYIRTIQDDCELVPFIKFNGLVGNCPALWMGADHGTKGNPVTEIGGVFLGKESPGKKLFKITTTPATSLIGGHIEAAAMDGSA